MNSTRRALIFEQCFMITNVSIFHVLSILKYIYLHLHIYIYLLQKEKKKFQCKSQSLLLKKTKNHKAATSNAKSLSVFRQVRAHPSELSIVSKLQWGLNQGTSILCVLGRKRSYHTELSPMIQSLHIK